MQVLAILLNAVVTAAAWLYWAFGICLLFQEVCRRKEAADLEAAVDEMTSTAVS